MDIYAPIAHRLGDGQVARRVGGPRVQASSPEDYRELTAQMENGEQPTKRFSMESRRSFQDKMQEAEVPFARIEGRVKRLYSIWKKLHRQEIVLDQVLRSGSRANHHADEIRNCYAASRNP